MHPVTAPSSWTPLAASLPGAHLLQSWEWGEFKGRHGWAARRLAWDGQAGRPAAAAQVLERRLISRLGWPSILYAPRGPLLDWSDEALRERVLDDLQTLARRSGAIFLKVDPGLPLASGLPGAEQPHPPGLAARQALVRRGWRFSADQVQFRNTVTLDLGAGEAALLGAMKPKTRYNIRLAERKGVRVRAGGPDDLGLLHRLYAETAARDGFIIRPEAYYRDAWGSFMQAGLAEALIAEVEGQAVAGLVMFYFGGRALYMYGMSRAAHRDRMPNHLLQWEAIRRARRRGCAVYDFWGAPDEFVESDPLWGVWRFKEGFGGQVVRQLGAWDYAPRPALYWLYASVMPRVLGWMRRRIKTAPRPPLPVNALKGAQCLSICPASPWPTCPPRWSPCPA